MGPQFSKSHTSQYFCSTWQTLGPGAHCPPSACMLWFLVNTRPSFKTPEVSYSPHRHALPLAAVTISQPLALPASRLSFWSCSTCLAWGLQVTDSPWFHGMKILISPSFLKVFCWTEFRLGTQDPRPLWLPLFLGRELSA